MSYCLASAMAAPESLGKTLPFRLKRQHARHPLSSSQEPTDSGFDVYVESVPTLQVCAVYFDRIIVLHMH